ncbi:MAG TPA: AAA family ATPase [Candidatus Saccharimonadales bacterium]|nr:AAA family ATPase [Candidatus Saccharimonadales bacterium]
MPKLEVVYVEGLPGAGKSTLLEGLAERMPGIHLVGEYVDPTEADGAISQDDEEYFLRNDERKYRVARSAGGLAIVDRGHLSTILYNEGHELVTGRRQVDVATWYTDRILRDGMLPDAYIHLDTPPETTFARRPPTTDWDNMWDHREVLDHARAGYRDYMAFYERDVPVLRLPADQMSVEEVRDSVISFLSQTSEVDQ